MIQNILPPIIDDNARVLIVGSMPGVQSLKKQQYYGNPRNHFWTIIGQVLKVDIPSIYEERLQLLQQYRVALWDVIKECERVGSLDSNIKAEVPNDFDSVLARYPNIEAIGFNGTKAKETFRKKVGFEKFPHITFYLLPSSSPVPGRNIKTVEQKIESWKVLEPHLKG